MTDTSEADLTSGPPPGGPAGSAGPPDPAASPPPAPWWVAPLYLLLAVLLVPWTVYLGVVLPDQTTSAHWDVAWVGFDTAIVGSLTLTAWAAARRTHWVEASAASTATLLVVDAWFDCTTARTAGQLAQALLLAGLAELPLALLSLWIARHAVAVHSAPPAWRRRQRR